MKTILSALLLLPGLLLAAPPALQMGAFVLPEFDAGGAMVRRLAAESATGPLESPALGKGSVEFFGLERRRADVIGRLDFTGATYDRAGALIRGDGDVRFSSAQGDAWGTGFSYNLTTGELRLNSKVGIQLPQGLIHAAQSKVLIDPKGDAAGDIAIRRAELTGGVVVTELKDGKLGVDRIEAARANYDAADGLLRVPAPVDYWRGGEKGRLESDSITAKVGPVLLTNPRERAEPGAAQPSGPAQEEVARPGP